MTEKAARPVAQSAKHSQDRPRRNAPVPAAENPDLAPAAAKAPVPPHGAVSPAPTFPTVPLDAACRVATPQPSICYGCGVVETVREFAVETKGSDGGVIAGNYIGKLLREDKRYEAVVHFEDGSTRTFGSETPPARKSGDCVRLQNGRLTMGGGKSNGNLEII